MKKTFNVDLEKLDQLLEAKARNNFEVSNSKILDELIRARIKAVGVELVCVRRLLRDPDYFNDIWDIYMN